MKRAIVLLFAGLLLAQPAAFAAKGEQKEAGGYQQKRVENLAADLGLSADQKQKVSAIFKQTADEIKAEMDKIKSIRDAANEKLKGVLTPEQYQKLEKMKEDRMTRVKKKVKKAIESRDGQK